MSSMAYFQWQNDVLCKTIYPMREFKLRDFLVFYMEVDLWKQYKDKSISALGADVEAFTKAQQLAAVTAYKMYKTSREYFLLRDVRTYYLKYKPLDEAEITEINNFHAMFADSWPKDIRGERSFVEGQVQFWTQHRNTLRDWVKSRKRRLEAMDKQHPKYAPESAELALKEKCSLPMAETELDKLRAFLATYDKIEARKLAWYKMQKADPNLQISEAEYLVQYKPEQPITVRDIVLWKVEEYRNSLASKDQYQLLEEIHQRFQKEPQRFPYWLQYMVVHFSGMRYASAHSSWADPKDLLIRLRTARSEKDVKALTDEVVTRLCEERTAFYEGRGGSSSSKLAGATEKEWRDKIAVNLTSIKSNGPKTKRFGLNAMLNDEIAYEIKLMTTQQVLDTLLSMKASFPAWAWKEIVKLTPLRVTQVIDPNWEKPTEAEETERYLPQYNDIRMVLDAWQMHDPSAWREEHGRTHELIVSRAVCNETAEHIQHMRGHLPPGGLTPKPKWYLANESENKIPGTIRPYYVKPKTEKDYTQGASILWLRFVSKEPDAWQIARNVPTKDGVGLLPDAFTSKKAAGGKKDESSWVYNVGETITRTRTVINADNTKSVQNQWLRWIHEATVAEVGETANGKVIITFETALPDGDKATSCVGISKMPFDWFISDGTEDEYNRSFVGYVPEGQLPMDDIKTMLDWNKILNK